MARLARIVAPGCSHHVTARGNRREPIFFEDGDQELYADMLAEQTRRADVEVWAYCLMPNHVHLILAPHSDAGMAAALGSAHRRWANHVNAHPLPRISAPVPYSSTGVVLARRRGGVRDRVPLHRLDGLIEALECAEGGVAFGDQACRHVGEAAGVQWGPAAVEGGDEAGAEGVAAARGVFRRHGIGRDGVSFTVEPC